MEELTSPFRFLSYNGQPIGNGKFETRQKDRSRKIINLLRGIKIKGRRLPDQTIPML